MRRSASDGKIEWWTFFWHLVIFCSLSYNSTCIYCEYIVFPEQSAPEPSRTYARLGCLCYVVVRARIILDDTRSLIQSNEPTFDSVGGLRVRQKS